MVDGHKVPRAYHIQHCLWKIIDWVYPPRCAGCGQTNQRWCQKCHSDVIPIDPRHSCPICSYPHASQKNCPDCKNLTPEFTALESFALYKDPIRKAIHRLKYESDIGLAEILAQYLAQVIVRTDWQIDLVTAVPLSRQRMRQRGYNQSALLARNLAWFLNLPFSSRALIRVKETQVQVGLDSRQRKLNVDKAFLADPRLCAQKSILVVDDVATTGATLSACAQALKSASCCQVYAVTLARAVQLDMS